MSQTLTLHTATSIFPLPVHGHPGYEQLATQMGHKQPRRVERPWIMAEWNTKNRRLSAGFCERKAHYHANRLESPADLTL